MLKGKKILLGITGGIAAYKAAELVRLLRKQDAEVFVVMTDAAKQFITPLTMHTLSGNPVFSAMFDLTEESRISHIELARQADVVAIVPATADFIAKAAMGLANDLLSTIVLATTAPLVFAPAMNRTMWSNPITQRNVETLKTIRKAVVVEPQEGELACGEEGAGRLAELEFILDAIYYASVKEKDLAGERILVSAGPTVEDIDPVRFISNRSSGKMGYAIAREAAARGAEVVLVSGPTQLLPPWGVEVVKVRSADQMYEAITSRISTSHIIIMAAAVADFKPQRMQQQKIKKESAQATTLHLVHTRDILAEVARRRARRQFIVGFAAETSQIIQNAKSKLKRKGADLIVANDVSSPLSGFGTDTNAVYVIDKQGHVEEWELMTKQEVAKNLFDLIQKKRATRRRKRSKK